MGKYRLTYRTTKAELELASGGHDLILCAHKSGRVAPAPIYIGYRARLEGIGRDARAIAQECD